ncbi:(deoxy)nucleoside triphosphate pyrophosphohydrolase [Pseudomonadota bacterium]
MKKVEVVAAILIYDRRILCVQRAASKLPYISRKFEFPGGKIESNESKSQALQREIQEELRLQIKISSPFLKVEHQYPDFFLTMHSFICTCANPQSIELTEHISLEWLHTNELHQLDWAAADVPIVEKLKTVAHEIF